MGKVSISIVKGKGSTAHNNREIITDNVDVKRIDDNIIYKKESLTDAYKKCFGSTIDEYNTKQKRADRKINGVKGYMDQVRNSGNGEKLFYENVIQIGNMQDCKNGTSQGKVAKEILDDYMLNFQSRNPNLYVFNAVLHLDEQTPHLHVDYIPLADGYKKGLQMRNSLDRALKQQGLEGKSNKYENRTIAWQNVEKSHIEKLMNSRGLERSEDKGLRTKHKSIEYYKAIVGDINNRVDQAPKQIESKPTLLDKQRVTVKKDDLECLEIRSNLSLIHEESSKKIFEDISKTKKEINNKSFWTSLELSNAEKIKEKYSQMYKQQEDLNDNYKDLYEEYQNQKTTILELSTENTSLKAQNDDLRQSFEQKVQTLVEPLKDQIDAFKQIIDSFENRKTRAFDVLKKVIMAFNMLKYNENGDYKVDLTQKQSLLFDGIENYAKTFLYSENENEIIEELSENIGISSDIAESIEELTPIDSIDHDFER